MNVNDKVLVNEPILGLVREPATVLEAVRPTRRRPWASVVVAFDDPRAAITPTNRTLIATADCEAAS